MQRKVLLVDDSEYVRDLVEMTLEDAGFLVISLNGPFAVASRINEERPDLVLVDVNMPALPGDKVVEFVRRGSSWTCPIVLFSDRPESELKALALRCGAAGYIRKTGDLDGLGERVSAFIRATSP